MRRILKSIITILTLIVLMFGAGALFYGTKTVHDLLGENKKLKKALTTLTHEDQIGYAKVIRQEEREGRLYTTLRFVETARGNKLEPVLEKEFTIEGDVVHFDALVVTFSSQSVMDGKERSLYLWRRVYGEHMVVANAFPIEQAGAEPRRYSELLGRLPVRDRELFWSAIWELANDPEALQDYGIKAIYGNAVYKKLRPGLIYVFKISASGQVYPETVPDL